MAILAIDGAEAWGSATLGSTMGIWTTVEELYSIAVVTGMTGSYCLRHGASGNAGAVENKITLSSSQTTLYMSFKYNVSNILTGGGINFYDSAGTAIAALTRNTATRFLEIRLGSYSGTVKATGTNAILDGTTYLIEIKYVPLNSGGEFTVKVNGVQEVTYTGDITNGLEDVQTIGVRPATRAIYMDDLVIGNSAWLGNVYIAGLPVTGAGASTQWDPSTGNNWDCVNEVPVSDTDYVSTNTTDEVDTYALTDLSGSGSILALQVYSRHRYTGTPTPTKQQVVLRSGGTNYFGDDISPTLSFCNRCQLWDTNPADDAAWEEADINSLEVGVKAIA